MILSHRHRFIFVRTRKTASTSMEIELSRHVGPDDIVTSMSPRDEALRRQYGGRGPQNHLHAAAVEDGLTPPGPGPDVRFYNHMPAREIRALVGDPVWASYFTFCFDRSPWEKVVSLYYHRHRGPRRPSLREFVDSGAAADAFNWPLYTHNGDILVDFVGRYEQLDRDLRIAFRRIGIPVPERLPRAKTQFRPPDAAAAMDLDLAARIAEIYQCEIARHGYEPPRAPRTPAK
jgi:hypothetical protein